MCWLKIIQSFGGDSSVLVVGNKIDQHPLDIDRTGLQKKYPNIVGIFETSAATGAGIEALKEAITEQINSQTGWATVTTNLQEMSLYEAQFQANLLTSGLAVKLSLPSDSKIISYVNKAIMSLESGQRVDAGTWAQFVQANKDSQAKQINSIVRAAYARGEAMQAISKEIRQSFDGLIKREAETLARTGFAHYAAQANEAMIQDNKDLLKEYYYVVVFDSRTSDICISADLRWNKKRFKVDEKAPTPPLHYNCRTRRIAVPDGWEPKAYHLNQKQQFSRNLLVQE